MIKAIAWGLGLAAVNVGISTVFSKSLNKSIKSALEKKEKEELALSELVSEIKLRK